MPVGDYKYRPLKYPTSIRLLRVKAERAGGKISCILHQFDDHCLLDGYSALSNYWGEFKHTKQIYLGDTLIDIHEALWEFLDEIQRSQETRTWFWTDFVCLDQGSKTEIGQQVESMDELHAEAEETISWLGCGSSTAERGVPDLRESLKLIDDCVSRHCHAVEDFFAQLPN